MHKSTSTKRKSFTLYALLSMAVLGLGAGSVLLSGVTPATAASLASQPDTQIAVFMVPLTLLVLAVLWEVARFAMRGNIPEGAPARQRSARHWTANQRED